MIEKYGLFDSVENDQREYAEEDFSLLVKALGLDGVRGGDQALKITAAEAGLRVKAAAGMAIVQGRYYVLEDDGSGAKTLDLEAAMQYPRIDRIVLTLDFQKRTVKMGVLKGVENAGTAPELRRDTAFYMLSLAQVRVDVGVAVLNGEKITDERADRKLCGLYTADTLRGPKGDRGEKGEPGTKGDPGKDGAPGIAYIEDTREDNQNPEWYMTNRSKKVISELKQISAIQCGMIGPFVVLITIIPWTDQSGGYPIQIVVSTMNGDCKKRIGISGTEWGPWKKTGDDMFSLSGNTLSITTV